MFNKAPFISSLAISLALVLASSAARATSVTLANPSFETPTIASDGSFVTAPSASGTFNGWGFLETTNGGNSFLDFGIENPSAAEYNGAANGGTPSGADGTDVAFLNNNNTGGITEIYQDAGILAANTTYTLTIAVGQRLDRTNGSVLMALIDAASGSGDPFGTGTILNSTTGVSSVAGTFQDFITTFTTGNSVSGDLYIGAKYVGNGTVQASLDNVRLTAVVPEPSSVVMVMLSGIGMLVGFRRSRRR
jgi:hypothetical protein